MAVGSALLWGEGLWRGNGRSLRGAGDAVVRNSGFRVNGTESQARFYRGSTSGL